MWIPLSFTVPLVAGLMLMGDFAFAQCLAVAPTERECPPDEPDSVQISWDAPCESGTWLMDTEAGCRMWDWHPDVNDTATWTGACPLGLKDGQGIVQWFEHGEPIDRFEGTYRAGMRQGFGLYAWNKTDRYEGNYEDDRPDGFGTAHLAGEVFTGQWKNGCLKIGERVVAIGVPRSSCSGLDARTATRATSADYRWFKPILDQPR
jgi:MORN repeat